MKDNLKILKVKYISNHLLDNTQIWNLSLDDQIIFLQIFEMKTTCNGRGSPIENNLKILKVDYLSNHNIGSYLNSKLKLRRPNHISTNLWNEDDLQWKRTSNGRQPQNIKSDITKQLLIGSYSNFKLKLRWPNFIFQIHKMKMTSNGRQLQV